MNGVKKITGTIEPGAKVHSFFANGRDMFPANIITQHRHMFSFIRCQTSRRYFFWWFFFYQFKRTGKRKSQQLDFLKSLFVWYFPELGKCVHFVFFFKSFAYPKSFSGWFAK